MSRQESAPYISEWNLGRNLRIPHKPVIAAIADAGLVLTIAGGSRSDGTELLNLALVFYAQAAVA
jgi:hypothetical protein